METLRWQDHTLYLLDQTQLPLTETYLTCTRWPAVADAIRCLAVRGAPAIGVAATYGAVLGAQKIAGETTDAAAFGDRFLAVCDALEGTRPTAVNLHWALARMRDVAAAALKTDSCTAVVGRLEAEAMRIDEADREINRRMGQFGAAELAQLGRPLTILTHCNAGALATAAFGTALGVVRALHAQGLVRMVYADETRPLLQGARLTTTELAADGIPVTLITDNMAAWTMKTKGIDAVIVGADRIAANGDTANKIGTYGVTLLAAAHGIPFYVAAPVSTFDRTLEDGTGIPIEERAADEVRQCGGLATALPEISVFNPAFDVTPHEYITAIVTEHGVLHHPDSQVLHEFFRKEGI